MAYLYVSPRRLAANKENAQKSTGPKTAEGKAHSAQNASTHGLYSAHLLQQGENHPHFIALRNALLDDLCPQNFLELAQADRIISLHWKILRLQQADNHLNQMQNLAYQTRLAKAKDNAAAQHQRLIDNCQKHQLEYTEADLPQLSLNPDAYPDNPPPAFFIAQELHTSCEEATRTTSYERLLTLETKLQSLLNKATRDYRQTQKDRQTRQADPNHDPNPTCPYVPDDVIS